MKFVVALFLCVSLCLCLSLTRASVIAAPIPALPPVTIACCPSSMSLLQGNGGCFGGALPAAMPRLTTRPGPRKKVRIRGARPRVVILSKQPRPYRLPYPALISFSSPRGLYPNRLLCVAFVSPRACVHLAELAHPGSTKLQLPSSLCVQRFADF